MHKTCSHCKKTKDIAEFNKYKSSEDGYDYYCRTCRKNARSKREQIIKNNLITHPVTEVWCRDCATMKPASEFHKVSSNTTGVSLYCRDCARNRREKRKNKT